MTPPPAPRDVASPEPSLRATPRRRTAPPVPTETLASTAIAATCPGPDAMGLPASKRVLRSQGRRTMRRLLDAAMVCFDERGYYETRVNDVVNVAKTSHGTFYLYFSNKEDLLRALVSEAGIAARYLADSLNRAPESGGKPQWEDVRGWVSMYSDLWVRHAALFRAWTDLARIDPDLTDTLRQIFALMSSALTRQIALHDSDHNIDAHAAAMGVLAMLDRFHDVRRFMRQPVDDEALDTLATMIYRALFSDVRS